MMLLRDQSMASLHAVLVIYRQINGGEQGILPLS
jgi:hypothetical protein